MIGEIEESTNEEEVKLWLKRAVYAIHQITGTNLRFGSNKKKKSNLKNRTLQINETEFYSPGNTRLQNVPQLVPPYTSINVP